MFTSGGGDRFAETPTLSGLLAWNSDPAYAQNTLTPGAATIHLSKIYIPNSITATNIGVFIKTAGTSYTNTQLGLYSSAGVILKATAVLASAGTNTFGATGYKSVALSATQALTGGTFVWVAVHAGTNSATAFQCAALAAGTTMNLALSAANYRAATQTGHATNDLVTVGNLTPASNANPGGGCLWACIS